MAWIKNPFAKKQKTEEISVVAPVVVTESIKDDVFKSYNYTEGVLGGYVAINTHVYDGEKTPGELGNPINLIPNHNALRLRAYEAELKSDVVKIITGKFFKWVVGDGLKIQPQPNEATLKSEGIEHDWIGFRNLVEARWKTFAESTLGDYSGMNNLHHKAAEAFDTSFLGGDCLVILRADDNLIPNVQVIDGQHLGSPVYDSKFWKEAKERGNRIKNGIEIDAKGKHVAFYVRKDNDSLIAEWERVVAIGENSGCLMAWMIYGKKHRIDHTRGITQIAPILEKIDKLDRFTEASVGAAEERAKVPWFFEHNQHSDGENPLIDTVKAVARGGDSSTKNSWELAEATRKEVYISQQKTVTNLPIGTTMKAIFSQAEINYDSFFKSIFVQLCASCDIPPEVALQEYNSNYSASRAAINGWGFIIDIYRKKHARKFYKPVYQFWLYLEVLKGNIDAPGYLKAKDENNFMVLEAYTEASFLGVNLPHIDPLKEVKAIRAMIGDRTKGEVPLISLDQATEQLNNGDFKEILKKYLEEMESTEGAFDIPEPIVTEPDKTKEDAKPDNTK